VICQPVKSDEDRSVLLDRKPMTEVHSSVEILREINLHMNLLLIDLNCLVMSTIYFINKLVDI